MENQLDYNNLTSAFEIKEPTSITDIFLKVLMKHVNTADIQDIHLSRQPYDDTELTGDFEMVGDEGMEITTTIDTSYFRLELACKGDRLFFRLNQLLNGSLYDVVAQDFGVYHQGVKINPINCSDPFVQIDQYVSEVLDEFNSRSPK